MPRHLPVSSAHIAVVVAVAGIGAQASAADISTPITTPVKTSTANSGAPDAITITAQGSVKPASGQAVTIDSNHSVTNQGAIAISNSNGSAGIVANTGTSGDIVNSGTITIDETYTPTDTDNDGDLDGPFATGSNRFGIRTDGVHTGKITNSGTITVEGNSSAGIWLGGAQNGNFTQDGKIEVTGDNSVGVHVGDITGNVRLAGTVTATGQGSNAAHFTGDVDGAMVVQGAISSTGYRYPTPPANTSKLDADDLLQGGSALVVEGNVTGGIVLAVPPRDNSATDNDEDKDGIEDAKEGSAAITTLGAAPAFIIGHTSDAIAIGPVAGSGDNFGLLIEGTVAGHGVYSGVDGNGLLIGGRGGAVTIANGIGISGGVAATSNGANATAVRLGAGASTPELRNSGTIAAAGGGTATSRSTAVQVDAGASLGTIRNSGTIKATAGGAAGTATAILDASGSVTLIENSGAILASGAAADSGRNVAIDLSANTSGVTVKQTQVASGIVAPSITGDVRFGSGSDVFEIADGTVKGTVGFGEGDNTLGLLGDGVLTGKVVFGTGNDAMSLGGTSAYSGVVDFGGGADSLTVGGSALFAGSLVNSSGLAVNVTGGALDIAAPATVGSLNVGAGGTLVATLDKAAGQGTHYTVGGTASFASGSNLLLRLGSTQDVEGRYVIVEAGTLEGASGITTKTELLPYMFKGTVATDAGADKLAVDIVRRTTTELGLNRSQSAAYDAVYAALAKDDDIESVFLGITNGDGFRSAVRQMLPDHAGGAFASVSLGSRTFARQVSDPQGPTYKVGGLDIILHSAGWTTDKDEGNTAAYDLGGFGFAAAAETETGVGTFGAQLTWLWNEYTSDNIDNKVLSDTYELSAYWRGKFGPVSTWARGSYGLVDFSGRRTFSGQGAGKAVQLTSNREWGGTLVTFAGGASFEGGGKAFFFRPGVSFDYTRLKEDAYTDTGGGKGLDLSVDERVSDEFAVNGGLTLGMDLKGTGRRDNSWFRVEGEGGWREVVGGALGETVARFEGGTAFTLLPDQLESGWFAKLRALGGDQDFQMSGEVGAEDRQGGTAFTLRGTLRLGF